jgi:hypothetical protein
MIMIGFISTSVALYFNYIKYTAISDLRNLQFTDAHALGLSVFSSRRLLATDISTETSASNHYEVLSLFRLRSLCISLSSSVLI